MIALPPLIVDAVVAVVLCPIAAITAMTRTATLRWLTAAAVWLVGSGVVLILMGVDSASLLMGRVVLIAAACACAGVARVFRTVFSHPLDAIAATLCVSVSAVSGAFALGRFTGEVPPPMLDALLTANPLVAAASAASIDIFRTELLYRASPLASVVLDYPSWRLSTGLFSTTAAASVLFCRWAAPARTPDPSR